MRACLGELGSAVSQEVTGSVSRYPTAFEFTTKTKTVVDLWKFSRSQKPNAASTNSFSRLNRASFFEASNTRPSAANSRTTRDSLVTIHFNSPDVRDLQ